MKCTLFILPSYKDDTYSESAYSCLLFCKNPSLNLHKGTSLLEKQVERSTRHLQDDVCTTRGTEEKIKRSLFQTPVIRALMPLEYLSLFSVE